MLYVEYIEKANKLTITKADNGLYYLEPLWQRILYENDLDIDVVTDYDLEWDGVYTNLELEVKKRNTINSKTNIVLDWLYNVITTEVDPVLLQEETDYIKQMAEFKKALNESNKLKDTE